MAIEKEGREAKAVDGLAAWTDAGDRLRQVEPDEFSRMLALARAFVSIHDRRLEDVEIFQSRVAQIVVRGSKVTA